MSATPGADELRIRKILRSRGVGPNAELPEPDAVTAAAAAAAVTGHAPAAQPQPTHTPAGTAAADDWWEKLYAAEAEPSDRPAAAQAKRGRSRPHERIPHWFTGRHVDLAPPTDETSDDEHDELEDDSEDQAQDEEETGPDTADGGRDAQPPQPRRSPRLRSRRSRSAHRTGSRSPGAPRALTEPLPRRSLLDAYDAVPPRIRWLLVHATAAAAGYRIGWVDFSTRTAAWIAEHGRTNPNALFWYGVACGCALLQRRMHDRILIVRWLTAVPIASIVTGTALYGTGWTHLELPL